MVRDGEVPRKRIAGVRTIILVCVPTRWVGPLLRDGITDSIRAGPSVQPTTRNARRPCLVGVSGYEGIFLGGMRVGVTTAKEIVADNVGPVEHLVIPVPAEGGVVVLRGPNDIGKSTMLRAATALLGSKKDQTNLRPTDGCDAGKISYGECTITVGRANRRKGSVDVLSIAGDVDLSTIVDPGIIDVVAADKRRLQAIFSIAGESGPTGNDLRKSVDSGDAVAIKWDKPLLDAAHDFREYCLLKAREAERQATECEATCAALGGVVDVEAPTVDEIQSAKSYAQSSVESLVRIKERHRLSVEHASRVEKAKAQLATLSPPESIDDIEMQIKSIREKVQKLDEQRTRLIDEGKSLASKRDSVAKENSLRASFESILSESADVVTEADIDAAQAVVDSANTRVDALRKASESAANATKAKAMKAKAVELSTSAESLRKSAGSSLDEALGQLVGSVFPDAKFKDGRLAVKHRRGVVPFSELSEGARWTMVLDLAIKLCPERTMITIPQQAWDGLDGANRKLIAQWARSKRIVVMSAEASDDEDAAGIEIEVM